LTWCTGFGVIVALALGARGDEGGEPEASVAPATVKITPRNTGNSNSFGFTAETPP
jgi:hypothetical protein